MVVNLADQKPKLSEIHSSTLPQGSDSDSESEIELRSAHTSPETTTSEESDGTLVDTSTSTTPTPSLLGEGDLDTTKGHSQLPVGTLPLADKDPPENPQEKNPPPGPSGAKGPTFTTSEDNSDNLPGPRDKETVTTPPSKELEHEVTTPPSYHREDSPTDYLPKDNSEAPVDSEDVSVVPPTYKSQRVPQMTLSLDSGWDRQLIYQIKTKRDIGGWIENQKGDIQLTLKH